MVDQLHPDDFASALWSVGEEKWRRRVAATLAAVTAKDLSNGAKVAELALEDRLAEAHMRVHTLRGQGQPTDEAVLEAARMRVELVKARIDTARLADLCVLAAETWFAVKAEGGGHE
jgi:hypothetical protein